MQDALADALADAQSYALADALADARSYAGAGKGLRVYVGRVVVMQSQLWRRAPTSCTSRDS